MLVCEQYVLPGNSKLNRVGMYAPRMRDDPLWQVVDQQAGGARVVRYPVCKEVTYVPFNHVHCFKLTSGDTSIKLGS